MKKINTKDELESILDGVDENELVILKYSATWCTPCQMLTKTIEKIEDTLNGVTFIEADCDEVDDDLIEMNNITNIPRMIYYKGGLVIGDTVGNLSEDKLLNIISEYKNK